jgi:hypothetical protein
MKEKFSEIFLDGFSIGERTLNPSQQESMKETEFIMEIMEETEFIMVHIKKNSIIIRG